jgi:hypothetical protein
LPTHNLRNGRLNQTAYALYLFIRDIADNDLVGWIEGQLASAAAPLDANRLGRMRDALLEPLRHVYGVSDKVLSMALSVLLLSAPRKMQGWAEVGAGMIAIDTLVHNLLVRTGILQRFEAGHPYGPACYQVGGCADIIQAVADQIDASQFNPRFPKTFPRFVQHAIWRYCAEKGLNVCNGNRINDDDSCDNPYCQLRSMCDRVALRANVERLGPQPHEWRRSIGSRILALPSAIVGVTTQTNRRLDGFDPCKVKEFFDTLSSRIAAARSSSLVKNFLVGLFRELLLSVLHERMPYVMQPGAASKCTAVKLRQITKKCRKLAKLT